ncbi:CxxH/CxxC protein [Camelliibacillus cellulosilyticus]|uniref:CxxH/CxxC protein n=1 Tax=Camelliibacillus cellulosilyticus TaxID=2174486 RepID=A0ABV9GSQ0_9BACL
MPYCCLEHVELALEAAIDETQLAPEMEVLPVAKRLSTRCDYCDQPAIYLVTNSRFHTECGQ